MPKRYDNKNGNARGITEQLKTIDQMAWVQMMNNIRNRAEEVILREYVYEDFEK